MKAAGTGAHGKIGIYAPNVPQWMVIIQACNRSSAVVGEPCIPRGCSYSMHALRMASVAGEPCVHGRLIQACMPCPDSVPMKG